MYWCAKHDINYAINVALKNNRIYDESNVFDSYLLLDCFSTYFKCPSNCSVTVAVVWVECWKLFFATTVRNHDKLSYSGSFPPNSAGSKSGCMNICSDVKLLPWRWSYKESLELMFQRTLKPLHLIHLLSTISIPLPRYQDCLSVIN